MPKNVTIKIDNKIIIAEVSISYANAIIRVTKSNAAQMHIMTAMAILYPEAIVRPAVVMGLPVFKLLLAEQ